MGIFFDALKVMFGGSDDHAKWADPKCPSCRGTGLSFPTYERCWCVNNAIIGAATDYRLRTEQHRQEVTSAPVVPSRPVVDLSGFGDVQVRELSPAEREQQRIEAKVRYCVTLDAKQAIDASRLTVCCAHNPCVCGVNHWMSAGLTAVPPPPGSPWYQAWLRHRQFVDQLPLPAHRAGFWTPPPGFFDQ